MSGRYLQVLELLVWFVKGVKWLQHLCAMDAIKERPAQRETLFRADGVLKDQTKA
jgi:hypothetical protein